MIKNTIIRIDENNLIMLEINPEEHSGQGGILDTETGTFYPFSTVVDPTKSSIVRFDDTNVVLIKLDPDTHDSSAIIMDEVSGNVYPIGGGPVPDPDYILMYQGNYCVGSTNTNIVSLITKKITLEPDETLTVLPDTNYNVFPVDVYGNDNNETYEPHGSANQMYIYSTYNNTPYSKTNLVSGRLASAPLYRSQTAAWQTSFAINNHTQYEISLLGLPFLIHKVDQSDITPEEAIQHVTIEVS